MTLQYVCSGTVVKADRVSRAVALGPEKAREYCLGFSLRITRRRKGSGKHTGKTTPGKKAKLETQISIYKHQSCVTHYIAFLGFFFCFFCIFGIILCVFLFQGYKADKRENFQLSLQLEEPYSNILIDLIIRATQSPGILSRLFSSYFTNQFCSFNANRDLCLVVCGWSVCLNFCIFITAAGLNNLFCF